MIHNVRHERNKNIKHLPRVQVELDSASHKHGYYAVYTAVMAHVLLRAFVIML